MTDKKRTFVTCRHTCKGRRPCICAQGHKASHICFVEACICHAPAAYGLELAGSVYRRTDVRAGVRVLRMQSNYDDANPT